MSTEQVTSTLDDGVLTLTLNRPDELNADTARSEAIVGMHAGVTAFFKQRPPAFSGRASTDLLPQSLWWAPARPLPR